MVGIAWAPRQHSTTLIRVTAVRSCSGSVGGLFFSPFSNGCVCSSWSVHLTVGVPREGTDAHEEQDDAEGGHRDWEEDPLGFDTNPMLLRAMCMAFE